MLQITRKFFDNELKNVFIQPKFYFSGAFWLLAMTKEQNCMRRRINKTHVSASMECTILMRKLVVWGPRAGIIFYITISAREFLSWGAPSSEPRREESGTCAIVKLGQSLQNLTQLAVSFNLALTPLAVVRSVSTHDHKRAYLMRA